VKNKLIINDKELLKLQKRFRMGDIKEEDLSPIEVKKIKRIISKANRFCKRSYRKW